MKSTAYISSVKSDISLPKRNLEAIADNGGSKHDSSTANVKLRGYESVSWRFLNALGIGNVWLTLLSRQTNKVVQSEIPVSGSFMAVCTKSPGGNYKFQFAISLS